MLVAGATGAGASLLSGSKGSWVSLFIIGTSVAYLATTHLPAWRRQLAAVAVIVSLLIAGLLTPSHAVQDLVVSGLKGGGHWMQTGQVNEGSVGMRFAIWRLSLLVIAENTWFGHRSLGAHQQREELSQKPASNPELLQLQQANKKFVNSQNELPSAVIKGGMLGALDFFMGHLELFLSVAMFGMNAIHTLFLILSICLLALLFVRFDTSRNSQ
jgi:hypothetical protein